jgi:predicted DNA binding protein/putative methionine-R-sulfoxide reductase with GAF domain
MTLSDDLHEAPIGVIETTTGGEVIDINQRGADLIEGDGAELRGTNIIERFPKSAAGTFMAVFDGEPTDAEFREYYPRIDRWLAIDVSVGETVVVYIRDRTRHEASERTTDALRNRLERVQDINNLVASVLQQVIGAASREDVGRLLCDRLGGADLYRFAWVGEQEFPNETLSTLAAAGAESAIQTQIETAIGTVDALPEHRAAQTGETQYVEALAEDESVPDGVRRAAFGQGLQSCLAIPLAYQGTVYGVVSVYSGQEDGFSEQERVGLETLASVAGFAIRAIRQEGLLLADTVTEVTLAVDDETLPFVRAAAEANTTITLDGAIPRGDGSVVCYLGGDGIDTAVEATLTTADDVTDVRWIREETDPRLQATVTGQTALNQLVSWGATVREAEYMADSARIVAEVPPDGDVRRLVEAVDSAVAATELVTKSEMVPDVETAATFRESLDDRLTDRQHAVLRTAYRSDYFASPRGSTSAEVADSLEIAGSTLLHHLRRAEQELVAAYLDRDRTSDP